MTTASFHDLPAELCLHIFSFVPHPSYATFPERNSTLCAVSRISRHFHSLALPLLYGHIYLPVPPTLPLLLHTLASNSELAEHVRTIRLGRSTSNAERRAGAPTNFWKEAETDGMGELVRACRNVEQLWMACCMGVNLAAILAYAHKLKHLSLSESRVFLASPLVPLPALSSLYLKSLIFPARHLAAFLNTESLPSLTTIDLLSVHEARQSSPKAFSGIAHQLSALSVGNYRGDSVELQNLAECPVLTTLDIPIHFLRDTVRDSATMTKSLPPSLKYLRLRNFIRPTLVAAGVIDPRDAYDFTGTFASTIADLADLVKTGQSQLRLLVVPVGRLEEAHRVGTGFKVVEERWDTEEDGSFVTGHESFRQYVERQERRGHGVNE